MRTPKATLVSLPSDRITLSAIRARTVARDSTKMVAVIGRLLRCEDVFVAKLKSSIILESDPYPDESFSELRRVLIHEYQFFGIADSPSNAIDAINGLEQNITDAVNFTRYSHRILKSNDHGRCR